MKKLLTSAAVVAMLGMGAAFVPVDNAQAQWWPGGGGNNWNMPGWNNGPTWGNNGNGNGRGWGNGNGNGRGWGNGNGNGWGNGQGNGWGTGNGSGTGNFNFGFSGNSNMRGSGQGYNGYNGQGYGQGNGYGQGQGVVMAMVITAIMAVTTIKVAMALLRATIVVHRQLLSLQLQQHRWHLHQLLLQKPTKYQLTNNGSGKETFRYHFFCFSGL